jgi:hypothetical protein
MSPRKSLRLLACAAGVVVAMVSAACHKSSEQKAEEAAQATAVKETKEEKARRELERGNSPSAARAMVEAQEADEKAAAAQTEVTDAVRHEQDRYRALLTKEVQWLDRRIADLERVATEEQGSLRTEKEHDIVAAHDWRERLKQDLTAIDHPPAGMEWTDVKKRVDLDLDENRPPSIPKSYEKPYGI